MSNSHLFNKSGFIRAPLYNGINRYVCQLKRITIKFCKAWGASAGTRDFIEKNLIEFSRENPGVVVYVKPRRHRSPVVVAEYLNGSRDYFSLHELSRDEIYRWINIMVTQQEPPDLRLRKLWHTESPSIQGVWNPFTNRDPALNIATFPLPDFRKPQNMAPTATEVILKLAAEKEKMKNPAGEPKVQESKSDVAS